MLKKGVDRNELEHMSFLLQHFSGFIRHKTARDQSVKVRPDYFFALLLAALRYVGDGVNTL
jgi:hypothetical protein